NRHHTPWGDAINFDGPESRVVRDFFIHNALYWLEEYNFDGLRLDAVHAIVDESSPDILTELAQTVRERFGAEKFIHLIVDHGDNRGEPSADLPPSAFISFLQNHDQVGNRAFGERISQVTDSSALKAVLEIFLLAPPPPLIFMGEEFAASSPFLFFCDFHGDL